MAAAGTGAIEIYVGTNLVWKDGVPGPAYAQMQCYAKDDEHPDVSDEGRLWTYWRQDEDDGLQPPPNPSCRVVWGAPQNGFALSFNSVPGDAPVSLIVLARPIGRDGWRITVGEEDSKPEAVGTILPSYAEGVPVGLSSVSMSSAGVLDVYVRPLGEEYGVFSSALEELAESFNLFGYQLGSTYPSAFETLGGGDPTPPLHFWTNFRKCKEIGV